MSEGSTVHSSTFFMGTDSDGCFHVPENCPKDILYRLLHLEPSF